jgi:hypothetical protein
VVEEEPGFRHGRNLQLHFQDLDASLVLTDGRRAVSHGVMTAHELAVDVFPKGIVAEEVVGSGDGLIPLGPFLVVGRQAFQGRQVGELKASPVLLAPVVIEIRQEPPPIQAGRPIQALGGVGVQLGPPELGEETSTDLELPDIDPYAVPIQEHDPIDPGM